MLQGIIQMMREAELKIDGWSKRTILDEPRLSEVVELYKSLGFEVLVEPAVPGDFGSDCSTCFVEQCDKFSVIYVRESRESILKNRENSHLVHLNARQHYNNSLSQARNLFRR